MNIDDTIRTLENMEYEIACALAALRSNSMKSKANQSIRKIIGMSNQLRYDFDDNQGFPRGDQ
jgi:hypothetical protein